MGACNFVTMQRGASAQAAFDDARWEARSEFGSEYTGSIAEKDGFIDFTFSIPHEIYNEVVAELERGCQPEDIKSLSPHKAAELQRVWQEKRDKAVCVRITHEPDQKGNYTFLFCGMAAS